MSTRKLGLGLITLYAGEIGGKLLAILVFGRLAQVLGHDRYGELEYALGLLFVANLVLDAGLAPWGAREAARRPHEIPTLAGRILRIRLLLLLVASLGLALAALLSPGDDRARLLIALFALVLVPAPLLLNWAFEARGEMGAVAASSFLRQVLLAAGVFLLVASPDQVLRVPLIDAAAFAAAVTLQQILMRRRIGALGLRRAPGEILRTLRESSPLLISSLVWALRLFAPLLALRIFVSAEETARFGAAHRLVVGLHALVWLYFVNLLPEMARRADDRSALGSLLRRSCGLIAAAMALLLPLGILLAEPVVTRINGQDFASSARPLAILGGLLATAFLSGHVRYALIALGRQDRELVSSLAGGLVSIAGVLILAGRLDAELAAGLLVLAEVVTGLVAWGAYLRSRPDLKVG